MVIVLLESTRGAEEVRIDPSKSIAVVFVRLIVIGDAFFVRPEEHDEGGLEIVKHRIFYELEYVLVEFILCLKGPETRDGYIKRDFGTKINELWIVRWLNNAKEL